MIFQHGISGRNPSVFGWVFVLISVSSELYTPHIADLLFCFSRFIQACSPPLQDE